LVQVVQVRQVPVLLVEMVAVLSSRLLHQLAVVVVVVEVHS
jgi:hypothetical protein